MSLFDTVQIRTDFILGRLTRQMVMDVAPEVLADVYIAPSPLLGARGVLRAAGHDVTRVDLRRIT